jgi:hypothetical protein
MDVHLPEFARETIQELKAENEYLRKENARLLALVHRIDFALLRVLARNVNRG